MGKGIVIFYSLLWQLLLASSLKADLYLIERGHGAKDKVLVLPDSADERKEVGKEDILIFRDIEFEVKKRTRVAKKVQSNPLLPVKSKVVEIRPSWIRVKAKRPRVMPKALLPELGFDFTQPTR